VLGTVLCSLVLLGCTHKTNEDFIPAPDNARSALEKALQSWKAGQPVGRVAGASKPGIEVVDSEWKSGKRLLDFTIIQEDSEHGNNRSFTVRLTPAKGPPREVKYVIVGIDPLWIYRDTDFQKLSGAGM